MAVPRLLTLRRAPYTWMVQLTRLVSHGSAVVQMTNLRDGIGKRFCRSMSHRPANWFHSRLQQISSPLVPPSTVFSLVRFPPKLYSSLPKSQLPLTTHFCPASPTVEATQRFPCSAVHSIMAQHRLPKFHRGFPQSQVPTSS